MKKKTKKLVLSKETLRDFEQLGHVQGAATSIDIQCHTHGPLKCTPQPVSSAC